MKTTFLPVDLSNATGLRVSSSSLECQDTEARRWFRAVFVDMLLLAAVDTGYLPSLMIKYFSLVHLFIIYYYKFYTLNETRMRFLLFFIERCNNGC